jgi:hypothetical protein
MSCEGEVSGSVIERERETCKPDRSQVSRWKLSESYSCQGHHDKGCKCSARECLSARVAV